MKRMILGATVLFLASLGATAAEPKPAPKPYTLKAAITPAGLHVGAGGKIELTLAAQAPYHLKVETPFKAVLTPSAGLTLDKAQLDAHDYVDPKADAKTAAGALKATAVGDQQVAADLTFFLCTEEMCQRFQEHIVATSRILP